MRLSDLWRGRARVITPDPDYPMLEQVIRGWLHQDMDLFHSTMSDAIAGWSGLADPDERARVVAEIDRFFVAEAADPDAALVKRWGLDVDPPDMGRSSTEFLHVVRAIAVDPAAASRFRERW